MAGFCRNCGTPFDDATAFCGKCGTATGTPPVRPSSPASAAPPAAPPQARPPAQAAAAVPQSAAPAKSGNTFLKVLVAFVVVIFVFGAIGIAGIWYVAHLAKQKAHEMGFDDLANTNANANRGPVLGGRDACSLLSKEVVSQAAKMEVVRAEATQGKGAGCMYSVLGEMTDLVAKHAAQLPKGDMTEQQRQQMETFAKTIFQNANSQRGGAPAESAHPGESPVLLFTVDNHGARAMMSMSRMTMGRLGPSLKELSGLGDEAFDLAGVMIMVRKGDQIVTIMYMMCPCTTDDVAPLAKKIVDNM
jgi:hypothetical protein